MGIVNVKIFKFQMTTIKNQKQQSEVLFIMMVHINQETAVFR